MVASTKLLHLLEVNKHTLSYCLCFTIVFWIREYIVCKENKEHLKTWHYVVERNRIHLFKRTHHKRLCGQHYITITSSTTWLVTFSIRSKNNCECAVLWQDLIIVFVCYKIVWQVWCGICLVKMKYPNILSCTLPGFQHPLVLVCQCH